MSPRCKLVLAYSKALLHPRALGSRPKRSLSVTSPTQSPAGGHSSNKLTEVDSKTHRVPFHVLNLFGSFEIGSHKTQMALTVILLPTPLKSWY